MENQEPKKTRRPRRKKQVEVTVDSPVVDSAELDANLVYTYDSENEAFEWVKPTDTSPTVEVPKEEPPKAEVKPWKRPCRPMTKRQATGTPRGVRKRQ